MLKKRLITAALLIPVIVSLILFTPERGFLLFTGFVMLMGAMEWLAFMKLKSFAGRLIYLLLLATAAFLLLLVPAPATLLLAFIWWVTALILVVRYKNHGAAFAKNKFIVGLMGALVLLPCWYALNFIRVSPNGAGIIALLYLMVLVWGADTAAYFAGKHFGNTKLAPAVSPGKTVAGFVGALMFTLVFSTCIAAVSNPPAVVLLAVVIVSLVSVCFSVVGDLFESLMKREAGFKDSGNLLPGHGGLLDRIDSLTAAAPVYAFFTIVFSILFTM